MLPNDPTAPPVSFLHAPDYPERLREAQAMKQGETLPVLSGGRALVPPESRISRDPADELAALTYGIPSINWPTFRATVERIAREGR